MSDTSQYQFDAFAATDLTVRRGGRLVFEELSFTLGTGELILLKGPNGTGKSTLLRALAGLLAPKSGQIVWNGEALDQSDISAGQFLIYQGHRNALKPVLTLRQNLTDWAVMTCGQAAADEQLFAAADVFDMADFLDVAVRYFSSGQLHRAALMRFMLADRPIWLMDEPTVGLDTENRDRLAKLIDAHRARGGAVIAATHDPISSEGRELNTGDFQPAAGPDVDHDHLDEAWV